MARPGWKLILALAVLSAGSCNRTRPTEDPDARLVSDWLRVACANGNEYPTLRGQIQQRGPAIEPLLRDAFRNGPDPRLKEEAMLAVDRNYAQIQAQLARPNAFRLTGDQIAWMQSVSPAKLKDDEMRRLDYVYREGALAALFITRGQIAIEVFKEVLDVPNSPFRWLALQFQIQPRPR
jgi:hypothetical protein